MPAVITAGTGKAVGKDAALQIPLERLAHEGLWGAVVGLAIELACAGHLQPSIIVLGYRLVEQRARGLASGSRTLRLPSAVRRVASTQPTDPTPTPTMMVSYGVMLSPP